MQNLTSYLALLLLLIVTGCAQSSPTARMAPRAEYDRSEDVTRYTTPMIRLTQEVHLTRHPIHLTISGGCEGQHSHCRPDDVLWEFDAPPEYSQFLASEQLDVIVDDQYHSFHMDVYHGRYSETSLSQRARFRIPFAFTEQVGNARNVTIKMGGNDIRIDARRREVIRQFVAEVQAGSRSS